MSECISYIAEPIEDDEHYTNSPEITAAKHIRDIARDTLPIMNIFIMNPY